MLKCSYCDKEIQNTSALRVHILMLHSKDKEQEETKEEPESSTNEINVKECKKATNDEEEQQEKETEELEEFREKLIEKQKEVKKDKNKSKGLGLFIAVIIGAIAVIIGAITFYLLIKNKQKIKPAIQQLFGDNRQQTDNKVNQSSSFNNRYSGYLRGY